MRNDLTIYRRHNPKHCRSTDSQKCSSKQRPCPIWLYGRLADGTQIRESLKTRDWRKAEALKAKWEETGTEPKPVTGKHTVAEWRERFLQAIVKRNLAEETIRKYRFVFRQLEAFAQDKGLRFISDFNPDWVEQFRNTWNDKPLSASRKIESLKTMFKYAVKPLRWIDENPAADLEKPKTDEDTTGDPFTQDEMARIIQTAKEDSDPRVLPFILTMRFAGLRISDASMLRVGSLQGEHIALRMIKTHKDVKVLLEDWVADTIRATPHDNPQFFFTSGNAKVTTATNLWRKRLARVFERAGISDGHSHRLRDTFAVELLIAGVSMENVSRLLGHRNQRITELHYAKWTQQRQDAADEAVKKANGSHQFKQLVTGEKGSIIPMRKKA